MKKSHLQNVLIDGTKKSMIHHYVQLLVTDQVAAWTNWVWKFAVWQAPDSVWPAERFDTSHAEISCQAAQRKLHWCVTQTAANQQVAWRQP